MKVYVDLHEDKNMMGQTILVSPQVVIEHSPREGYDHEKLRALEVKLTDILRDGLNDAMEGAK